MVPLPPLVCVSSKAGGVSPVRGRYDGEREETAPPRLGVGSEHTQEPGNVSNSLKRLKRQALTLVLVRCAEAYISL